MIIQFVRVIKLVSQKIIKLQFLQSSDCLVGDRVCVNTYSKTFNFLNGKN